MTLNYFYDGQVKRYLQQIIRVFSNFQINTGMDRYGTEQFLRVPCVYGDPDRMAEHIIRQNSENTQLPVPFIAIYDTDLEIAADRRQNPTHVDKRQVFEREFDFDTNQYTELGGYRYQVDRYMPIPYNMTINVDVWYTQTDHKMQICEQIMMIFNPDINIQTTTNPLDWTGLTVLNMEGITWNSRGVPVGIDDGLRITTFTFEVPIWINPPSKLKQQKVIHQIIADLHIASLEMDLNPNFLNNTLEDIPRLSYADFQRIFNDDSQVSRLIITPGNHYIDLENNIITLLGADQGEINPETGEVYSWRDLIDLYDAPLVDNVSLIRLRPVADIEEVDYDFIGRIRYHPTDANKLIWSADLETIPLDTIPPIYGIIDPDRQLPGEQLPTAVAGQRYIIGANEIRPDAQGNIWSNITANVDDVIEFDGANWSRVFDASAETGTEYTTHALSGKKLKFDQENGWIIIPDGIWSPGYWRIAL